MCLAVAFYFHSIVIFFYFLHFAESIERNEQYNLQCLSRKNASCGLCIKDH